MPVAGAATHWCWQPGICAPSRRQARTTAPAAARQAGSACIAINAPFPAAAAPRRRSPGTRAGRWSAPAHQHPRRRCRSLHPVKHNRRRTCRTAGAFGSLLRGECRLNCGPGKTAELACSRSVRGPGSRVDAPGEMCVMVVEVGGATSLPLDLAAGPNSENRPCLM